MSLTFHGRQVRMNLRMVSVDSYYGSRPGQAGLCSRLGGLVGCLANDVYAWNDVD